MNNLVSRLRAYVSHLRADANAPLVQSVTAEMRSRAFGSPRNFQSGMLETIAHTISKLDGLSVSPESLKLLYVQDGPNGEVDQRWVALQEPEKQSYDHQGPLHKVVLMQPTAEQTASTDSRKRSTLQLLLASPYNMSEKTKGILRAAVEPLAPAIAQAYNGDPNHQSSVHAVSELPLERMLVHYVEHIRNEAQNSESIGVCLFMDLDHLKETNDRYGHNVGDRVIRAAAKAAEDAIRALGKGKVAHAGGTAGSDEFVAFVPYITLEDAATLAISINERMGAALDEIIAPHSRPADAPLPRLSIGYSALGVRENYRDGRERADAAMYANKKDRKSRTGYLPRS